MIQVEVKEVRFESQDGRVSGSGNNSNLSFTSSVLITAVLALSLFHYFHQSWIADNLLHHQNKSTFIVSRGLYGLVPSDTASVQ